MAEVRRGFAAPPEVTGYFDAKNLRPAFSWLDVWGEEHAHAVTVAKAVDVELLGAFRRTIAKAIAEGQSFETWRDAVQEELTRLGWWAPRRVDDPDGGDPSRLVDFSSRRRLGTIFHSNMRAARAAGQWQRAQRTKKALPFLLYVRSAAIEPRPAHLAWAGIILPVDDPFWETHFPPNGWGCLCAVRQITRRERDRLLEAEKGPDGVFYVSEAPDLGPPQQFRNRRTGEITEVPVGIDPGWHTNPGLSRSRTLIDNLAGKLEAAPPADARRVVEELWQDEALRLVPGLPAKPPTFLPAGVAPALQAELGAASPIVSIEAGTIRERMTRHKMTVDDFAQLPGLLAEAPPLPNLDRASGEPEPQARTLLGRVGKTWWRAIVVKSKTGFMRVRSFHPREGRAIAYQILDAGLGRDGLLAAGMSGEEADRLIGEWRRRRGEGDNPIG